MIKTKQELLNHFSDINIMYNNPFKYQTLSNMIDELLEQQPCEDCISREEALKHTHIEYDDDGIGHRVVYAENIEELPSVTPSIPDVEDNFDIGYNCSCADAMCDIGGES